MAGKNKNITVGISALGSISASESNVRVKSSGGDVGIGLLAGSTQFNNEVAHSTASSGDPAGSLVSPAGSQSSSESGTASLRHVPPGAYGAVTGSHEVTGTSVRTAEIQAGSSGHSLPLVAGSTHVHNEEVKTVVKDGNLAS